MTQWTCLLQVLSAAYAFGICQHAELAGLHGQRAISLAATGLPVAAFLENLTSVKVCTVCPSVRPSVCLPACLPACLTEIQIQLVKIGTLTCPVFVSASQSLVFSASSVFGQTCCDKLLCMYVLLPAVEHEQPCWCAHH